MICEEITTDDLIAEMRSLGLLEDYTMYPLDDYFGFVKAKIQANPNDDYLHGVICFDSRYVAYDNAALRKTLKYAKIDTCSSVMQKLVDDGHLNEIGYMFMNKDHVVLEIFGQTKKTYMAQVKKISKTPAVYGWVQLGIEESVA
jgi:hypothetical protein